MAKPRFPLGETRRERASLKIFNKGGVSYNAATVSRASSASRWGAPVSDPAV